MTYKVLIKKCDDPNKAWAIASAIVARTGSAPTDVYNTLMRRAVCIRKEAGEVEARELSAKFGALGAEMELVPLSGESAAVNIVDNNAIKKELPRQFCVKCGKEQEHGTKFCSGCGVATEAGRYKADVGFEPSVRARPAPGANDTPISESNIGVKTTSHTENEPLGELSDKWVWVLACVPILGSIIYGIICSVTNSTSEKLSISFFVILNTIFTALDTRELKAKGRESNFGWVGYLLIPVYLFMRAGKNNKKYGYAITWCVLFVVSIGIDSYIDGDNLTTSLGGMSTTQLAEQVQQSMIKTWKEENNVKLKITKDLVLIKKSANEYTGLVTVSENGNTEQLEITVICDGKSFIWKVKTSGIDF